MDKEMLVQTAKKLPPVNKEYAAEYNRSRDLLVEKLNQKMLLRPDINQLVGENNIEMMKDNHANHARFMESVFYDFNAEVLVDTVLWVFRAYRSRNFSSTYWAAQLNAWLDIYKNNLSTQCYESIYPYYNWMQINIPVFNNLAEENLGAPLSSH
ncbi:MAG: hypothetical protein JXR61_02815 [Prolixibacteraceae bacterium]|nr:hypothetical protein [Prolixibacteraceae bacterium]